MSRVENTLEDTEIESHSQEFHAKLGEVVLGKHRIYLDTKFWIYLRDAVVSGEPSTRLEIYNTLRQFVSTGVAICPLSYHVFEELMKQSVEKRLATARIMDELSEGICFIDPSKIVGQELINFIRQIQFNAKGYESFNPAKYVWTKVGFIMGELYATIPELPENIQRVMRIKFFDHLSKFTLVQMLEEMGDRFLPKRSEDIVTRLNVGKDRNSDWKTFHELYMHEVVGALDVCKEDIEKVCLYLQTTAGMSSSDAAKKELFDQVRVLCKSIYQAFDSDEIGKELPFIRVHSGLHAYFRWDKNHRFEMNDLIDFSHAAWALPYCDTFLTDGSLAHWVQNNLLKFHHVYGTKVIHEEKEALEYLQRLEKS